MIRVVDLTTLTPSDVTGPGTYDTGRYMLDGMVLDQGVRLDRIHKLGEHPHANLYTIAVDEHDPDHYIYFVNNVIVWSRDQFSLDLPVSSWGLVTKNAFLQWLDGDRLALTVGGGVNAAYDHRRLLIIDGTTRTILKDLDISYLSVNPGASGHIVWDERNRTLAVVAYNTLAVLHPDTLNVDTSWTTSSYEVGGFFADGDLAYTYWVSLYKCSRDLSVRTKVAVHAVWGIKPAMRAIGSEDWAVLSIANSVYTPVFRGFRGFVRWADRYPVGISEAGNVFNPYLDRQNRYLLYMRVPYKDPSVTPVYEVVRITFQPGRLILPVFPPTHVPQRILVEGENADQIRAYWRKGSEAVAGPDGAWRPLVLEAPEITPDERGWQLGLWVGHVPWVKGPDGQTIPHTSRAMAQPVIRRIVMILPYPAGRHTLEASLYTNIEVDSR